MFEIPKRFIVLVVDDDPWNITILRRAIGTDYSLITATNGREAIQKAENSPQPDLILLDIVMPEIDGYKVCQHLKSQESTCHIPVIFITAKTDENDEHRGFEYGAVDYITKPFSHSIVRARVRNQIELKKHQDHLKQLVDVQTHELYKAKSDVESANKAKGFFLSNMSHELRTPLNAILASTELAMGENKNKTVKNYLSAIQKSGYELLVLINDILDFSNIEKGDHIIDEELFKLDTLLLKVKTRITPLLEQNNVRLNISVSDSTPNHLHGDARRLEKIFLNLLDNAIKFSSIGCQIFLSLEGSLAESDQVELKCSVEDHGVGIPQEFFNEIFNPFFQIDPSSIRGFEGTGMGLSLCKQFTELMNGHIWVESTLGRGSTFHFYVRLKKAQNKQSKLILDQKLEDLTAKKSNNKPNSEVDIYSLYFKDKLIGFMDSLKTADPFSINDHFQTLKKNEQESHFFTQLSYHINSYEYDDAFHTCKTLLKQLK